jgi:hypothetical protein
MRENVMNRIRRPRRPSAAIVISLIALFFAMSGTAVAATGGDFILGKSNTAASVSALANSKGTALSLTAGPTAAPLTVSNSTVVPKLDASELGGTPASGFVQGNGAVTFGRVSSLAHGFSDNLLGAGGSEVTGYCDVNGTGTSLLLSHDNTGNAQAVWWNKDGTSDFAFSGASQAAAISPTSEAPYVVVAQMDTGTAIVTYTVTAIYNSGADTCSFTGQAVMTNG